MSDKKSGGGDWREWSQHVLIEIRRLNDRQEKMTQTLADNTTQLEIHIEGVRLAREQNSLMKVIIEKRIEDAESEIKPLKAHVAFVEVAFKFWSKMIAFTIGVPAGIYYCINIYMKLKGQ